MDTLFFRFLNLSPVEPVEWTSCFEGETARYLTLPSSEDSSFKFRFVLDAQLFLGLLFVNRPAMVPKTPCFRLASSLRFVTGEPFGSAGFSAILIVLTLDRRFDLVPRFFDSRKFANRSFSTTSKGPWSSLLESPSTGGRGGASVPVGIVCSEMECAGGIESEYGFEGPGTGFPISEDLRSDCPGGKTRAICEADWEGRMDERSEGASPGSGRGLEATGNLGECGGETRIGGETRRDRLVVVAHNGRLSWRPDSPTLSNPPCPSHPKSTRNSP